MTRSSGKTGKHWLVRALTLVTALGSLAGTVASESVVILQGYQSQTEKYAANTVDAYVTAFSISAETTVTALRPKSQPGWEGGETYEDQVSLLRQLRGLSGTEDLVLVLVGDADGPGGTFRVTTDAGVTASDLADAISRASRISLVSAGCNALAMSVARKLTNTSVVVSGISENQTAHVWPAGNRGQYDVFSRYLLEGYYLLATNASAAGSVGDLIGKAYGSAASKMIRMSGGRQSPSSASNYGGPVARANGPVISIGNLEYQFNVQDLGNGSLAGYVSNSLGLPISPIRSARIEGGQASFSFTERGRERTVVVADVSGVPAVTLDGKSVRFTYRSIRVDLLSDGRLAGVTYVTPRMGADPGVMSLLENGKSFGDATYDASRYTVSLKLPRNAGTLKANITFGSLGEVQLQVGELAYKANQVLHYGFYNQVGERVASAVALLSEGKLTGEVFPATSKMKLPLEATLKSGDLIGSASLVGNSYTLSTGWTWKSDRPLSSGVVQPDYFNLPTLESVHSDASGGHGSVAVTWEVDKGTISDALLQGDLRFQVVRTDRFNKKAETFDIPAGRRQYTDRPSGDPKEFSYAVRAILDHRVTTCDEERTYPLWGASFAAAPGRSQRKDEAALPAVVRRTDPSIETSSQDVVATVEPEEASTEKEIAVDPKEKEVEEKKNEKDDGTPNPWKVGEKEGTGGKIIYGLFGVMILIAIAIVGGGGGGGDEVEPF